MQTLRALRESNNRDRSALAGLLGVTPRQVAAWDSGVDVPDARQIGHLALVLGATPEAVRAAQPAPYEAQLARPDALQLKDREHFFAVAARAMRQLVIDHARQRIAGKRGGGAVANELDSQLAHDGGERDQELLALDQALRRLEALDAHLSALVEMRFFGGLELSEIATLCNRSERSLKRDWRKARAFLHQQLGGEALPADSD